MKPGTTEQLQSYVAELLAALAAAVPGYREAMGLGRPRKRLTPAAVPA